MFRGAKKRTFRFGKKNVSFPKVETFRFADYKYKKEINGLSREAKQKLMRYHWPGNVRELQHAIERAIILSDSPLLKPANFMLQPQPEKRVNTDEILNLEQLERNAIERAMKRSEGNLSRAAEYLGITRYALYRKLEKLGL